MSSFHIFFRFRLMLGASRAMLVFQIWRRISREAGRTTNAALGQRNSVCPQCAANAATAGRPAGLILPRREIGKKF